MKCLPECFKRIQDATKETKIVRTEEEQKKSIEIYDRYSDDLKKRELSNSEHYDSAIFSLSSAGLALSLTAIKYVIPLKTANSLWMVKLSWIFFLITIIISLVAYLVSNKAITKQLEFAYKYYFQAIEEYRTKKNFFSFLNSLLNYVAGITFILAISLVIFFVILNLNKECDTMNKDNVVKTDSQTVTTEVQRSANIPGIQHVVGGDVKGSANIPTNKDRSCEERTTILSGG